MNFNKANSETEVFTVTLKRVSSSNIPEEYNGATEVSAVGSFLFITIEDGTHHIIPDHQIKNVTVTPGRS